MNEEQSDEQPAFTRLAFVMKDAIVAAAPHPIAPQVPHVSQLSLEGAVEDGGEQRVEFDSSLGLQGFESVYLRLNFA